MPDLKTTVPMVFLLAAATATASAQDADQKPDWFDGKPRTFVVNGYSTSFQWPHMLQRKLDRHFDGERIIEVKLATQGGTPIARWMDVKTGKPRPPWDLKLRPLLSDQKRPTIVLAQQSLQWVFGPRGDGIANASDTVNIREGARVLGDYANAMLADGADGVVIAMHIYKTGMEPAIGNERLALEQFLSSRPEKVYSGPDVWEPTRELWPQAFQADGVHPNAMGAEVMAHHWFKSLLELCDCEVPAWSEAEMRRAIADPPKQTSTEKRTQPGGVSLTERMKRHDKNGDGRIEKAEFQGPANIFARFDRNQDAVVDEEELRDPPRRGNAPPR